MGWLPQSVFSDLKAEAAALTPEQRATLTWAEARRFVAPDTIDLATWAGLEKSGLSPWEAVAKLRGLKS